MKFRSSYRPAIFLLIALVMVGVISTAPVGTTAYADSNGGDPMPQVKDTVHQKIAPDDGGQTLWGWLLEALDQIF